MYEQLPANRTDSDWERDALEAQRTGTRVHGVFGRSFLSVMPLIKMMSSFTAEYMHSACLGLSKYFTCILWIDAAGKTPFNIGSPAKLKLINTLLKNIRLPSLQDSRRPRNFADRRLWKASEWKYWFL